MKKKLNYQQLGLNGYQEIWDRMRTFTEQRNAETDDEIWLVEHPPVFTQGQAGKAEHILNPGNIPVIQTDRGGQVTYHGPGQLVGYFLMDIKRRKMTIRQLVNTIEKSVIDLLAELNIQAKCRTDAPGVYVEDQKICSLGLRIRRGYSYHGLALNVDMDLKPFGQINPCGFENLKMIQISDLIGPTSIADVIPLLIRHTELEFAEFPMNQKEITS